MSLGFVPREIQRMKRSGVLLEGKDEMRDKMMGGLGVWGKVKIKMLG